MADTTLSGNPSLDAVQALADALGVEVVELFKKPVQTTDKILDDFEGIDELCEMQ